MQPDTPDEKEKRKNGSGITTSYALKILVFLLFPPLLAGGVVLLLQVLSIRFEDMPVERFILPNVRSIPIYLWIFLSVVWLLLWRKLFHLTRETIVLLVVHTLVFLAVSTFIFAFSLLFSRRLGDTIVIDNIEYAVTNFRSEELMLWVCPDNLCYGQTIMSLGSGRFEMSLETGGTDILQINTRKKSTCLSLQNLAEKIIARDIVLQRDAVDCPPAP